MWLVKRKVVPLPSERWIQVMGVSGKVVPGLVWAIAVSLQLVISPLTNKTSQKTSKMF